VSVAKAPIRVDGLTRHYGKRRGISDLTFEIEGGEIFGFLGPNGAGKTTTIRQLMGLMRPSSGSARIFGLDCWRDSVRIKEQVGFLHGERPSSGTAVERRCASKRSRRNPARPVPDRTCRSTRTRP
jgi:ABC-type multidrug transport system ATPase subunit